MSQNEFIVVGGNAESVSKGSAARQWMSPTGILINEAAGGLTVIPGTGSLTLSGNTPTVLGGVSISPTAGSLTLTSQTPLLTNNISSNAGSLVLTGNSPTLDTQVIPSAGNLVLTGQTAQLNDQIVTSTGNLTLTGQVPSLTGTVSSNTGSLTLTGYAPSLDNQIIPGTGSLTLTGQGPTTGVSSFPTTGSLVLTGYAPIEADDIDVPTGTLTLTGYAPGLVETHAIPSGALALTGDAPILIKGSVGGGGTGSTGSPPGGVVYNGVVMPSFGDDLGGVWVFPPNLLDLKYLLLGDVKLVDLSNLSLDNTANLTALSIVGQGITVTGIPAMPYVMQPLESITLTFAIDPTYNPANLNGVMSWTADGVDYSVPIVGYGAALIPYAPEENYTETLEFVTNVIEAYAGGEQRIATRLIPRQKISFDLFAYSSDPLEYAKFRAFLFDWLDRPFGIPVWWEQQYLTTPANPGDTIINLDTTTSDYRLGEPILLKDNLGNYEFHQVQLIAPTYLQLVAPITGMYPVNTNPINTSVCMPIRFCWAKMQTQQKAFVTGPEHVLIEFTSIENVDLSSTTGWNIASFNFNPSGNSLVVIDDYNYVDSTLQGGQDRNAFVFDSPSGQMTQMASSDRSRLHTEKTWWTGGLTSVQQGQADLWKIRQLIHYLKGQEVSLLPTFRQDFKLTRDIAGISGSAPFLLYVKNTNSAIFAQGRQPLGTIRVQITTSGSSSWWTLYSLFKAFNYAGDDPQGNHFVYLPIASITSVSATEELITTTPFPLPNSLGQLMSEVLNIDYLQLVRMEGDTVTVTHGHPGNARIYMKMIGVKQ